MRKVVFRNADAGIGNCDDCSFIFPYNLDGNSPITRGIFNGIVEDVDKRTCDFILINGEDNPVLAYEIDLNPLLMCEDLHIVKNVSHKSGYLRGLLRKGCRASIESGKCKEIFQQLRDLFCLFEAAHER